jgi:hypothetical protein
MKGILAVSRVVLYVMSGPQVLRFFSARRMKKKSRGSGGSEPAREGIFPANIIVD